MNQNINQLMALKNKFALVQKRLMEAQDLERREKLAFLIESDLNQAEIILAAKNINAELQQIAEKLANVQVKEAMPLEDQIRDVFGPDQANAFIESLNAAFQDLNNSLRSSKDQIGNAILRLEGKEIAPEGGDMNDDPFASENPDTDLGTAPEAPAGELTGDGAEDPFAGADAASGPADAPLGRAKRESYDYRSIGKKLLITESFHSLLGWLMESPEVASMSDEHRGALMSKVSSRASKDQDGVAGWIGVRKYGPAVKAQLNPTMIAPLPEDILSPNEKAKLGKVVGDLTAKMANDPNMPNKTLGSSLNDITPADKNVANKIAAASGKGTGTKVGDFLKLASDEMDESVATGAESVKGTGRQTDAGKFPANKNKPTATAKTAPKEFKPTAKGKSVLAKGTVSEGSVAVGAEEVLGTAHQTDAGKYPANKNKPTQKSTVKPKEFVPTAKGKNILAKGTVNEGEALTEKRKWDDDDGEDYNDNKGKKDYRNDRKRKQAERDSFDKMDESLNEGKRWDDEDEWGDDDNKDRKKGKDRRDQRRAKQAEKDSFDRIDESIPVEAYGTRGSNSLPWRKRFTSIINLKEWCSARQAKILGIKPLNEKIENVVDLNLPTNTYGQLKGKPHQTDVGLYSNVDNNSRTVSTPSKSEEGNANAPKNPTNTQGQIKGEPLETDAGKYPANKNKPTMTSHAKDADANLSGGKSSESKSEKPKTEKKEEPKKSEEE